jgi:hypothetical protein
MIECVNCRFDLDLDLVREIREGRPRLQVRRLKQSADGSIDLFVSPPIRDIVADWCRRVPQIPQLIQRNAQLTTQTDRQTAFNGRVDVGVGLRAWIKGLFPDALFAFGDQTGPLIAKTFWRRPRTVVNATALFVE